MIAALPIVLGLVAANPPTPVADSVAEAARGLERIELHEFPVEVPAAARPLLRTMKRGIRDMIGEALSASPTRDSDGEWVRGSVLRALAERGVAVGRPDPEATQRYGRVLEITAEFPEELPNHAVATTTLSIPCGSDTSLYVYREQSGAWSVVAAREADDYEEIDRAQGRFTHRVLAPEGDRHAYVVTANVANWCASCWSTLRLDAIRVERSMRASSTVLEKEYSFYACGGYTLTPRDDGFELRFTDDHDTPNRLVRFTIRKGKWMEDSPGESRPRGAAAPPGDDLTRGPARGQTPFIPRREAR